MIQSSSISDIENTTNSQQAQIQFVKWFRKVAPYVHAFKDKTFIIAFGGELIEDNCLNILVQDLSLLSALGIRLVLVYDAIPQANKQLKLKNNEKILSYDLEPINHNILECIKEASGKVRLDIESSFSQGLPNTPMSNAKIRIISGNFVIAKPKGIIDGIDYLYAGNIRKIDVDAIKSEIEKHSTIALLPAIGFSPTGESFVLKIEELATKAATSLKAEKLIFLTSSKNIEINSNLSGIEIACNDVDSIIKSNCLDKEMTNLLYKAYKSVNNGVERAHIVPYYLDGSILLEVFTHYGIGAMVVANNLDYMRQAKIEDIGSIIKLIEPLEKEGILIKRSRNILERDIDKFTVLEHDMMIYGCAALYEFPEEKMAEIACLTVIPELQNKGEGENLFKHVEKKAKLNGIEQIFVLTTRTSHWFLKRGFHQADISSLPLEKQKQYNKLRNSLIFIKNI
ncbi:Amino-acid acetyltransferase [Candidatus Kinetoplastibacterium sorsogonicusi]|uniref:Amino-acid acetyltransferase n=1 Tax=Candidatus Kinetoplastidibacterium kentomonadis TaxID=1576550 RepID=A0A3Q8ERC8_9PROT|nr:amino-acid N-acetyltransferase [Candidatus Kinetoplastibacterium sorsogonicusi]AWD32318.1 Amino-acid acetyltransferase [Candidatus Kinetoplastibacterium sorsogonicusi]